MTTENIPLKDTLNTGTGNLADGQYSFKDYSLNIWNKDAYHGGIGTDTLKNWYVRSMRNKIVQVGVIQSTKDKFKYAPYFDDNKFRANGRAIEYLLPQLKDGIVSRKDLSVHRGADFKRENEIPYVRIKKIMDHIYYDIIVEDRLLEGLQNEGLLGDITDEIKHGISKKIKKDLARAIEAVITDKTIYEPAKTTAKQAEVEEDGKAKKDIIKIKYTPETSQGNWFVYPEKWYENPQNIINEFWKVSSLMLEENTNLQKGWYDEDKIVADDAHWYGVPAEAEGYENIHLIITYDIDNGLVLNKYENSKNWELIDIRKRFGRVITTKLPNKVKAIMFQDEALKLRLKGKLEGIGLEHKYEPENGANWFFAKPIAHGGIITGLNYAAWVASDELADYKWTT